MAHQMGPQFGNGLMETDSRGEVSVGTLANDVAALKEMVQQQHLMINAWLAGTRASGRADNARAPNGTGECRNSEDFGDPTSSTDQVATNLQDDKEITEQSSKDIRRLLRDLKLERGAFDPKSEAELDDITEDWEIQAEGFGHDTELLRFVVNRIGSQSIREVARPGLTEGLPWTRFVDHLARNLFRFSRQLESVERQLDSDDRQNDVEEAIRKFRRLIERHRKLCRRWDSPNGFHEVKLKECLMRKLPHECLEKLMMEDWRPMKLPEFICLCQRTHDALLRCAELRRSERGIYAAFHNDSEPMVAPAFVPRGNQRNDTCHNCGQNGHFQRNCPLPKSKCGTCGRVGHHTEQCRKIVTERPLGQQTALIRNTRNGIFIEMKDNQNKQQVLNQLATFFNGEAEKQREIRNKARERRQRKGPEGPFAQAGESDNEIDDGLGESGRNDGRMINAVRLARGPKWWIRAVVAGLPVDAILDTGAEVSVLTDSVWTNLPLAVRANARCQEMGQDKKLSGLGGTLSALAIVDLPLEVGGITLFQQFWVVSNFPHCLLGAPWIKDARAIIDCSQRGARLKVGQEEVNVPLHEGVNPPPMIFTTWCPNDGVSLDACDISPDLTREHENNIREILERNSAAWVCPELGKCSTIYHEIDTGSAHPIAIRARKMSAEKQQEVRRQIAELLEAGAIEHAKGPWAAPLVLVPKKGGEWRMCVDFRELNQITKKDAYPLPLIDSLMRMFEGSSYFSTLDLKAGYHQVRMVDQDREKTAFITPFGLYQFIVMPFGLCNAPATFQRLVDTIFAKYIGHGIGVYLDDIVIYSNTQEGHDDLLDLVLRVLITHRLFLNMSKSMFGYRRVKYLGMIVDGEGIHPDPAKVLLVSKLQPPSDVAGLRRFLGTVGYFRQFIKGFASRAEPLTQLLRRDSSWDWSAEHQKSFEDLRGVLQEEPIVLSFPRPEWPWVLDTDASGTQVAAVLQQTDPLGRAHVVAYASRCLTIHEQLWPIRELEAFAIVWGILHFAEYLRGQPCFTVRTDHESLKWLWRTDNKRVARWALALQEFQFKVLYQKGSHHHHVDIFTRDVPITPMDEALTDRIALSANVFTVAQVCQLRGDPLDVIFPSVEDFKEEQKKEESVSQLPLECVNGLWMNRCGRVYVPMTLRTALMYFFHFSRTGGHQGITRTYNRMSRHFWWGSMKDDIQQYHSQCLTCMRRRHQAPTALKGNLVAGRPGQIVAIDVVGPVEHHQRRYYLFTIIDHFTKFAEVVVLTEITTSTVWQVFYVRWVAVWGCPLYLLSDNGPQFASQEFKQRCNELGIEKIYASPYHPQGNGVIESFHQFLLRSVSAYVSQTSWALVDIVASVLLAYRSTPHPATSESPYYLMTGLDMTLPHFQQWREYSFDHGDAYRRFSLLAQVRRECFDRVLRVAAAKSKDLKEKENRRIEIHDLVVCWLNPNEVSKLLSRFGSLKFAPRWSEPCRVVRFLNEEKTVMMVKSIWHKGISRKVHRCDILPLPKEMTTEALNMAKFEMIADLTRNSVQSRRKELSTEDMLRRIPAEDREQAQDRMELMEEAWKAPKPDQEKQATPRRADRLTSNEFVAERSVPSMAFDKKRKVDIHALWIHRGVDGP